MIQWLNLHISTAGGTDLIPGQEDPLEKGLAIHSSVLAWRFHGQTLGSQSQTGLSDFHSLTRNIQTNRI